MSKEGEEKEIGEIVKAGMAALENDLKLFVSEMFAWKSISKDLRTQLDAANAELAQLRNDINVEKNLHRAYLRELDAELEKANKLRNVWPSDVAISYEGITEHVKGLQSELEKVKGERDEWKAMTTKIAPKADTHR